MNRYLYIAAALAIFCCSFPGIAFAQNLTLTVTDQTPPTCATFANGTATVEVAGGQAPYGFSADGGRSYEVSPTEVFTLTGLSRGLVVLAVRDAQGERASLSLEVEAPEQLRAPYVVTNLSTCEARDASVLLEPTGGTPPYRYQGPAGNVALQDNLAGGDTYPFTVWDANNCTVELSVFIAAPLDLDVGEFATVAPLNCSSADGQIVVTPPAKGRRPFEYRLGQQNFQSDSVFTDLNPGTYTIIVQDSNGCSGRLEVELEPQEFPSINEIEILQAPACPEVADGEIVVVPSGDPQIYEFRVAGEAWQDSDTLAAIGVGSFEVQVRDTNGCEAVRVIEIDSASRAQIEVEVLEHELCPDENARNLVEITVSEGSPPYQYQTELTGGFVPNNRVQAPYGQQMISVRENNGCVTSLPYQLSPSDSTFRIENLDVQPSGCDTVDGAITVSLAGGQGAYQYQLDDGPLQDENEFTGLAPGEYLVSVTDGNCLVSRTIEIRQNINISTNVVRQPLCDGFADGIVEVVPNGGGAGEFQFSVDGGPWQNGPEVESFGLNSAMRVRTIEADGSVTCEEAFEIELEPQAFEIEVVARQPECDGFRGQIEFVTTPDVNERLSFSVLGPGATQAAPGLFENLTVGDYSWNVTSANGACEFQTETNGFTVDFLIAMQIDTIQPSNCNADDGSLIVRAYGNPPYEYALNGGEFQSENVFDSLAAGVYGVTVRDADGCEDVLFATLSRPQDFFLDAFTLYASGPEAADGLINISANGNFDTPLAFYFNGETLPPGDATSITRDQNITPGAYYARATDANDCTVEVYANVGAELTSFDQNDEATALPSFVVTGAAFVDANGNNVFDPGEAGLANIPVTARNNSGIVNYSATNPYGYYEILAPANAGRTTISIGSKAYHVVAQPGGGQYDITQGAEGDILNGRNFAFREQTPISGNARDMKVSITPAGSFRAGSSILLHLNVLNQGLVNTQGQAIYASPAEADFQSATPAFDAQNGDTYNWNYPESAPGSFQNIRINANLDGGLEPGRIVEFQAEVTPDAADEQLANNAAFGRLKIDNFAGVGNPFVQWGRTDTSAPYWEDSLKAFENEPFTYTLYFQNTTGQTLDFARVVSNIDPAHDLSSFQLLGSSHQVRMNMEAQLTADSPNRARPVLHFMFENIDLPSGPSNAADNIGFVKFQLRMDPQVTDCDYEATNTAAAYLDYGPGADFNPLNMVVNPSPEIINFAITPEVGVREGDTLTFAYDTTRYADEFRWNFGADFRMEGVLDGPGPYSSYYREPGQKEFELVLENSASGCTTLISRSLTIQPDCNERPGNGPFAARDRIVLNVDPEEQAYETQIVTFSAENEGRFPEESYVWDFGVGAEPRNANGLGPHEVVYAGLQPLERSTRVDPTLTVLSPACDYDIVENNYEILPCPESDFRTENVTSCESDIVEFTAPVADSVSYNWFNEGAYLERFDRTIRSDLPGVFEVVMEHVVTRCRLQAEFENNATNCDINVPTVFTPNGDGFNDEWEVMANNIRDFHVVIHNRYGQPVFETTSVTDGWRGEDLDGEEVPEGVYFFMLDITSFDGSTIKRTGNITLLR